MKAKSRVFSAALILLAFFVHLNCTAQKPVVLLGNSIVMNGDWRFDLHTVHKAAVVDYTSKQMTWVFNWGILPHNPGMCIVLGGQEDFLLNIPPQTVADNFIEVAEKLRENGITPVLTSVIPLYENKKINKSITEHNEILKKTCNKKAIDYIDLNQFLAGKTGLYQAYAENGRYINDAGYGILNEVINSYLSIGDLPMLEPETASEKIEIIPIDNHYLCSERIKRIVEASPAQVKIAMLGNSITENAKDWNPRLGRTDIRNAGQGGYTTGQMLWMLDTTVLAAKPEKCFIMGGVNDISIGVPEEVIVANLQEIIKSLKKDGIQAVYQSTLYQANNKQSYNIITSLNTQMREFCLKEGVDYLELNQKMSDGAGLKKELTTDGTHLNEKGYELWSGILREYLEKGDSELVVRK